MKNLLNFEDFINESRQNEPQTLANSVQLPFPMRIFMVLKTLGTKQLDEVAVIDGNNKSHTEHHSKISDKVTDWERFESPGQADTEVGADWKYSKKYNIISRTFEDYVIFFLLLKDLNKY